MQMTLEERERHAYIEGRTEEAALLAEAMDVDDSARVEIDELNDAIRKGEHDYGLLQSELDEKGVEIEELQDKLVEAREESADLREKLANVEQPLA